MKKSILKIIKAFYAILVIAAMSFLMSCNDVKPGFTEKILDDQAPENLWMKTNGDINGDEKTDILVGGKLC